MHPDERLIQIVPSPRQRALQEMGFYAFVHFTVNTFTDREWGDGTESPEVFNPLRFDPDQWCEALRAAGMKGLILTCKHHDGFCLWPSAHTAHTVAASPFGRDAVGEVAAACRRAGLKLGVYLSPWDRHDPRYGSGRDYDDFFIAQLTELLTGYGEIFCVWFDGACGEGPKGKKQFYDWPRYYETIRRLQPGATIHVCGPDVRWCGNEAGDTRPCEWSVVPRRTRDTEKVAESSQQTDDPAFRRRKITASDQDLGSRAALQNEPELVWYPAEVNTSIRPGWFWHAAEDDQVKPLGKLIDIYEKSVGGNATFLLNIPPTKDGLFHENDVLRLRQLGQYLADSYGVNLAEDAAITAPEGLPGHGIECVRTPDERCWTPAESRVPLEITLHWDAPRTFRRIVLQEQTTFSQRVEGFAADVWTGSGWREIARGTVIGHKRIIPLPETAAQAVRIRITDSRMAPTLRFIGVYA